MDPLPVPSECIDFTPPSLWPLVRKFRAEELPPRVPKHVWNYFGKRGSVPEFRRLYWGKFKEPAFTCRTKKPSNLPKVEPKELPWAFWKEYFEMFPQGHKSPGYSNRNDPEPLEPRYRMYKGSLQFNAGTTEEPIWVASTGVD